MELQYFGGNCLKINTNKATIIIDDNLDKLGLKTIAKADDIVLQTFKMDAPKDPKFTASMPGEYEVSGISIKGISARAHMDDDKSSTATIFTIHADDISVAVLGHIYPELSDEQMEAMGMVDVLIVPVGNSGYTMDAVGALKMIKKIEPKIVIPTHYGEDGVKYEVPQTDLAEALKELGMEPTEKTTKYKPKSGDLSESTKLVLLERPK